MTNDEERQHRENLRNDYTRRLRVLQRRAARQGETADPAVLTEIDSLKASIAGLDIVEQPQPKPEVMKLLAQQDRLTGTVSLVARLGVRVNDLQKAREEDRQDAREWREALKMDVQELRGEVTQLAIVLFRLLVLLVVLAGIAVVLLLARVV